MKNSQIRNILTLVVVLVVAIYIFITGGSSGSTQPAEQPPVTTTPLQVTVPPTVEGGTSAPALGQRTKTSGCVAANGLPDSACTPGAIFPDATVDKICTPGYSTQVRNVPDSVKNQVYDEYGITSHTTGQYEVDHLVSLELGGSNDISNLWPEAADPRPGFHEKDKVEDYLHQQVCDGKMSLQDAQYQIATNWLAIYSQLP